MSETVLVIALAVVLVAQTAALTIVCVKLLTERDHLIARDGKELAQVQRARQPRPAPRRPEPPPMTEEERWVLEQAYSTGELPDVRVPDHPEGLTVG